MNILPQQRPKRSGFVKWLLAWSALFAVLVTGVVATGPLVGSAQAQPVPSPSPAPPPEDPPPTTWQPPPEPPPPPPSDAPPLPAGSGSGRRVVYTVSGQRVWLVEDNGYVSGSWRVSGRRGIPRPGTYSVFSKSRHSSSGAVRMQYMVRFVRTRRLAIGFHSIPVNRRGRPIQTEAQLGTFRSHGCVRQSLGNAARMWEWAPVGTKVVVTP